MIDRNDTQALNEISPSEGIRKQIEALINGVGWEDEEDLNSRILRRKELQEHLGCLSGYREARLDTAEGRIPGQTPYLCQSPETYQWEPTRFLRGNCDVLERLELEVSARRLSIRDIEKAFREATGDMLLSRSAVSAITDQLWADYQAFCERDLAEFEVEYLFPMKSRSRCAAWQP